MVSWARNIENADSPVKALAAGTVPGDLFVLPTSSVASQRFDHHVVCCRPEMLYDFQTQTFLSDGVLSPIELIRRARVNGYSGLAITDHVGVGGLTPLMERLREDCHIAQEEWGILVFPGVELTHLPPKMIAATAQRARDAGATMVLVHGETPVEPVEPGTNRAAVSSPNVDILGHPGLITEEDARLAKENSVFLEISARKGHSLANGHIVKVAIAAGADMLVNSDAHAPEDLLTETVANLVAQGAGLDKETARAVLEDNPRRLIKHLSSRWPVPNPEPSG
jgi:putative hydrolase